MNQRFPVQKSPCAYNFADIMRGGTAPGPPSRDAIIVNKRNTNSSHKYMVNAMNYAAVKGLNRVTLKGKGWSSKGINVRTPRRSNTKPAIQEVEGENKRPKSFKQRLHSLDDEITEEEKLPMRTMEDDRPISRHKLPPESVGLDLPPWPCTPPDSAKLEMTWSYSTRTEAKEKPIENRRVGKTSTAYTAKRKDLLKAYRPITVNAWGESDGKQLKSRSVVMPQPIRRKSSMDEAMDATSARPKFITQEEKQNEFLDKRAKSAYKVKKQASPKAGSNLHDFGGGIRSAKASTGYLKSSLDPDFLNLFDNRL